MLDLSVDGGKATPVVLKEAQRDPVRGETMHVDLLRVQPGQGDPRRRGARTERYRGRPGVKEGGDRSSRSPAS